MSRIISFKKVFLSLLGLLVFVLFSRTSAVAQGVQLDIRNQQYIGSTFYFDVYLTRTSGEVHLGNADFVLTYNNSNFNSPSLSYVNSSSSLKNSSGASISYGANIATSIGTAGINANKLIINLSGPTSISSQSQFDANLARIDSQSQTHLLGQFMISGASNSSNPASLQWYTSGGGTSTQLFTHNSATPWKSSKITSITANNPSLGTEPSTQTSAFTISAQTDTTMSLAWTRGNGDSIIILAKLGSAIDTDFPADGTRYTAGEFGLGDEIGNTGVYVAYKGTGTSAVIEGLVANSEYYFTAIEYSGSGGYNENYNTTSAPTVNGSTNADEPDGLSSGFAITSYTATSLTVDFTNGNGANRIIVVREGSAPSSGPVDGQSYTSDTSFIGSGASLGGGKVVYSGNDGSPTTITGLTPGTEYYFEIYEYNGSGGVENYTSTALSGNRSTLASEPSTASSGGSTGGITTTSMTFSWNKGNGAEQIVFLKAAGAVDADPVDGQLYTSNDTFAYGSEIGTGNYAVYRGTDTFVTVTGLDPNTTYYYEVFEVNGSGEASNYLSTPSLTGNDITLIAEPTAAATGFNITSFTTSAISFDFTSGNGSNRIIVAREAGAVNADPVDGQAYTANGTFGSGDTLSAGNYVVYSGSGSSASISGLNPNTEYYFEVFEFNGSGGSENYLISSTLTGDRSTLDSEPTTASSGGSTGGVTTTSITFSWNKGNGAEQIVFLKAVGAVDAGPVDGQLYTSNDTFAYGSEIGTGNYAVYRGTDTFVTVTGLDPNTTYYYEVFEVNGSGEASNYLSTPSLTGNQVTLQDAPSTQASNFAVSSTSADGMNLTWTRGDGSGIIILAKPLSSISGTPVNGVTYSSNSTYGSGDLIDDAYVIYRGTGTSVSISGLDQDTTYYFEAIEYNGAAGSENYLVSSPATTSGFTKSYLAVVAMLEGPFMNSSMDTTLNADGYLPLSQPYNTAPWNHNGTESVASIPNANIVDWVYVEIRKSASAAGASSNTVIDSMAAFILNDGSIVDLDGSSKLSLNLSEVGNGQLYVVVYHRNHVGVLSDTTLTFDHTTNAYTFNFTSAVTQAYGIDALVLINGYAALAAGNADPSGSAINADDRDAAWDDRNTSGYQASDVNLDGNTDAADRSIIYNNTGKDKQIP